MVTPTRKMSDYEKIVFGRWQNILPSTDKTHQATVIQIANHIVAHEARYASVGDLLGIPYWVVGCLHYRETSLDFSKHLHNGDPLTAQTVHVPKGRPVTGSAPFTWEESAVDALSLKNWNVQGPWDIVTALVRMEGYNGFGYKIKGIPSPYVWNYTNQYTTGKFASDGEFCMSEVDAQPGIAAIMFQLKIFGKPMELLFPA